MGLEGEKKRTKLIWRRRLKGQEWYGKEKGEIENNP